MRPFFFDLPCNFVLYERVAVAELEYMESSGTDSPITPPSPRGSLGTRGRISFISKQLEDAESIFESTVSQLLPAFAKSSNATDFQRTEATSRFMKPGPVNVSVAKPLLSPRTGGARAIRERRTRSTPRMSPTDPVRLWEMLSPEAAETPPNNDMVALSKEVSLKLLWLAV